MKKTLSIFLAFILAFMSVAPAFAAETTTATNSDTVKVVFNGPSGNLQEVDGIPAYSFVKTKNGGYDFVEDPDGIYCLYKGRYMLISNVLPSYRDQIEGTYSPATWEVDKDHYVDRGTLITFNVMTNERYNVATVTVYVNGEPLPISAEGEYAVYATGDLEISVAETDAYGNPALLESHFNVKLTSDEGYRVMTLKDENYKVIYYGGSFRFRVKIDENYNASGLKVSVQRGSLFGDAYNGALGDIFDEEDMEMISDMLGPSEELQAIGVDEDGCRIYEIKNITSDCKVSVEGIKEKSEISLLATLKRIIRLILNLLGIKIELVESIIANHNVTVDNTLKADGVTYKIMSATSGDMDSPESFLVPTGDSVTVVVSKVDKDADVKVSWVSKSDDTDADASVITDDAEVSKYDTKWIPQYNSFTGEITYGAVYNIDNITADTLITIY